MQRPRGLRKVMSMPARQSDSPVVVVSPPLDSDSDDSLEKSSDEESDASTRTLSSPTVYGDQSQDKGDKVTFSIELTRLDQLDGMYSLDMRRLKGNLMSYKFLYDSLRE